MRVSIAIPTKNGGDLFHRVLQSVFNQMAPFPFDVVVADSGSTDGTLDFLKQQAGSHRPLHIEHVAPAEFGPAGPATTPLQHRPAT